LRHISNAKQSNPIEAMEEAGGNLPPNPLLPDAQLRNQERSNARSSGGHRAANSALHSPSSKEAPNISLNVHGGARNDDLYIVAACGIVLQFGVLIFSGLAFYYPGWNLKFKKDNILVKNYAYPLMLAGTLVLVTGMIICSAVIEKSTAEVQWVLSEPVNRVPPPAANTPAANPPAANTSATNIPAANPSAASPNLAVAGASSTATNTQATNDHRERLKAHILWLQKKHTCNDQSFESYVIFAKGSRDAILQSRRCSTGDNGEGGNTQHTTLWSRSIAAVAANKTEGFTLLGAVISLVGFVMQFQGLRGLNWTASVSQLVAVFAMTMFRAWVRRGLVIRPVAKEVLDGCEMDWLALRIAMDNGIWRYVGEPSDSPDDTLSYYWSIVTSPNSLACRGSWAPAGEGQTTATREDASNGQKAVRVRQRLGHLMKWIGPASKPAISVAGAIAAVMNTLLPADGLDSAVFYWILAVEVGPELVVRVTTTRPSEDGKTKSRIKFKVKYTKRGGWTANTTEIEAALSLWIYHIRERERERKRSQRLRQDEETGEGTGSDWLQEDMSLRTKNIRLLGPDTANLRRDLRWWIGDVGEFIQPENLEGDGQPLGFMGLEPKTTVTGLFSCSLLSDSSLTDTQISRPSHWLISPPWVYILSYLWSICWRNTCFQPSCGPSRNKCRIT